MNIIKPYCIDKLFKQKPKMLLTLHLIRKKPHQIEKKSCIESIPIDLARRNNFLSHKNLQFNMSFIDNTKTQASYNCK